MTKRGLSAVILLLSVAFVLLLGPHIYRALTAQSIPFGEESYYHMRIARSILQGSIPASDTLVYNSRPYFFGPFHVILAFASVPLGIELASVALPVLFGMLSLFFFYMILGKFGVSRIRRLVICTLLVSSPAFIGTFSQPSPHALAIPIYLVGFYALLHRRTEIFAFVVLASAIMFGFFNSLLLLVLLLGHYTAESKRKLFFLAIFVLSFIFALIYYVMVFSPVLPASVLSGLVSDFGGSGFGIFLLILAAAGLAFSWKEKYIYMLPYYLLLFLLTSLFFSGSFVIAYLAFVVALFAGEGFCRITGMEWRVSLIKSLTILIVVAGLSFSSASYLGRLSHSGPDHDIIRSLSWLRQQPQGIVFSHYSNGFWIEYFAEKPVLLDGFLVSDLKNRYSDSQEIFYSRNIGKTRKLLDKYNVRYIFIDESMKKGNVWRREDEGLLFVLRNRESFRKVFDTESIQVWEYKGNYAS